MLFHLILLMVTYILETECAITNESGVEEDPPAKGSPLTGHLLKFLNHFDDSIIGFHLVVPKDDMIMNNYVDKPSQVGKILEYVTQINYLRNMIENDPEVSLKRKNERAWFGKTPMTMSPISRVTNNNEPHHTDILIFSQMSHQRPVNHTLKKADNKESVIFVPYPRNLEQTSFNEVQNLTDVYSKPVGYKTNSSLDSKSRNSLQDNKLINFPILKKFEEGLRVYPLISVSQRNDSIDCFTGKVNCSQQEICFLGRRICSKAEKDNTYSENLAFLARPNDNTNPSILFIPKSIDKLSSYSTKENENEGIKELYKNAGTKENKEQDYSMTFLAPLSESALVLPMKNSNGELVDSLTKDKHLCKYCNHFVEKREDGSAEMSQDTCNKCSIMKQNYGTLLNNNPNNSSYSGENSTTNVTNLDSDYCFADILRESIVDLVNGVDCNTTLYGSVYNDNDMIKSNSNLNDYNMYFLLDSENECNDKLKKYDFPTCKVDVNNVLYSSPKSKTNEASLLGFDNSNFIGLADYWPFIMSQRKNNNDFEKQKKDFFCSSFDDTDMFYDINSFYRDKIGQILSHVKKGKYEPNSRKRKRGNENSEKEKRPNEDLGNQFFIKYVPKILVADQTGNNQKNNFTIKRIKRSVDDSLVVQDNKLSDKNTLEYTPELSNFTKPLKNKMVELSNNKTYNSSLNDKDLKRIYRGLGKILLAPQVDKNFRVVIVYPYQYLKNKKFKSIVSKSVKKNTGKSSRHKTTPSNAPLNNGDVLQQLISISRGPDFKVQLDKKFLTELNKQKSGKMDPKSFRKLENVLKPVSYYEKDEGEADHRKSERKYVAQPNFLSLNSPLDRYSSLDKYSFFNNSDATNNESKFPVNISDLQAVKLFQRVTAFPSQFYAKESYSESTKNRSDLNDMNLLRNLSAIQTLDALKTLQKDTQVNEDGLSKLLTTTEFPNFIDKNNIEVINNTNLHPIHSSNGFKVSNATNLLIKLTEFKESDAYNRLKNLSYNLESEESKIKAQPPDSPVTSNIILMQKPSEPSMFGNFKKTMNPTERPFGSFFKFSKALTSALVSSDRKSTNNYSVPLESDYDYQVVQSTCASNEVQVPRTDNETENVNYTVPNVHYPQNVYTFTEAYDRSDERVPTGTVKLNNSKPHTTRSWSGAATVTTPYEDDEYSSDETEDPDVGSMYPDFAPVISVNIFPILGGWRRPQMEATALIKELFRKTPKKVVEEELPIYLSELFGVKEENKTQNKEYNCTQKKLDTILSGQCSINDILKLKLQNILQVSNKPAKKTKSEEN